MTEYNGGSLKADHLCVLVHGLWGNPSHLASLAKALRAQHGEDELYLLVAKSNTGYFTYDGIETGGERLCVEVEAELAAIKARGGNITKLSVVGYSLGGLVARYAIGLLNAKGILDDLECLNFTAFASPFLGVRSPTKGWTGRAWNGIASRMLSASGRQLFLIDKFRDTKRPLLAVLADPDSIFMSGLAKFKRRTLYANIANDRSAVYYTTSISKTDPYTDLEHIKVRYAKGYEDVILDPSDPVTSVPPEARPKKSFLTSTKAAVHSLPRTMFFLIFVPIGLSIFLASAGVQSVQSSKRIKLHEGGKAGIDASRYRVPLWLKQVRGRVEDAYETVNSSHDQEYLGSGSDDSDGDVEPDEGRRILSLERKLSRGQREPTLALAPEQFSMINALDNLGWRKYPVWIHSAQHSHAAIIIRWETARFDDGKVVLRHWVNEEFLV